jgi:hypothetical protein
VETHNSLTRMAVEWWLGLWPEKVIHVIEVSFKSRKSSAKKCFWLRDTRPLRLTRGQRERPTQSKVLEFFSIRSTFQTFVCTMKAFEQRRENMHENVLSFLTNS